MTKLSKLVALIGLIAILGCLWLPSPASATSACPKTTEEMHNLYGGTWATANVERGDMRVFWHTSAEEVTIVVPRRGLVSTNRAIRHQVLEEHYYLEGETFKGRGYVVFTCNIPTRPIIEMLKHLLPNQPVPTACPASLNDKIQYFGGEKTNWEVSVFSGNSTSYRGPYRAILVPPGTVVYALESGNPWVSYMTLLPGDFALSGNFDVRCAHWPIAN